MPATSSSPHKRPVMAERSSSAHSLSSSGRPATVTKPHRVHVVTKHNRNSSHGKGLNRLGKVASNVHVAADGKAQQKKKSGPTTPTDSPKSVAPPSFKRNSSHVALPKNSSHVNLRKNHSASALSSKRNRSHGALQKLGANPAQKTKDNEHKQGVFALGDQSSENEDDGEWEDSTTHSPELSRNQSKTSTPLRSRTPNNEIQKPPDRETNIGPKVSDPPEPIIVTTNRSAPNLRRTLTENPPQDPALLQAKPRPTKAPPAMSTISALANPGNIQRSDSARSLSKVSQTSPQTPSLHGTTPGLGTASSGSGGVSHFLQSSSVATSGKTFDTGSDEDSSSFMANYKPQLSNSPEKQRSFLNKMSSRAAPSRTNQKMELQRRETMRAGSAAAATPGPGSLGLSGGSAISIHSRSASKVGIRNRSAAGEMKALKQDYELAVKQLTVVRRFRNPMLESLHRLQDNGTIPSTAGSKPPAGNQSKSRPQSRRAVTASTAGTPKGGIARSPEDKKATPGASRSNSQAPKHGRVQFQLSRQGSHEDINLTTSQGSPGDFEEEQDGISPEEALIRRIWESRVVYENEGVQTAA